jgi:hypothetical protein
MGTAGVDRRPTREPRGKHDGIRPMIARTWTNDTRMVTDGLPAILLAILAVLLALGVAAHVAVA